MKRIFENLPEPGRERKYFSLSSLSSKHPENIFFHGQVLAESHLLFKSSFSWVELSVSDPVPETFHDSPKFWDPWRSRRLVTPESSKSLLWLSGKTTFCWNLIWMIRIMTMLRIMKTMWIFVITNMKNHEFIQKSPKVLGWLIVNQIIAGGEPQPLAISQCWLLRDLAVSHAQIDSRTENPGELGQC